ncbi:hypothetical protein WA158_000523 [Blastocystis sp. Blastoise]
MVEFPAKADPAIVEALCAAAKNVSVPCVSGLTMSADDFYEGQARVDGFYCDYTYILDKFAFIKRMKDMGIKNIEMEALRLLSFCQRSGIKAGTVCAAILNRENGDNVTATGAQIAQWVENSWILIFEYIRECEKKN